MTQIPEYKPKADKPPKIPTSSGGSKPKRGKRTPPKPTVPVEELEDDLTEFFIGLGVMTMMKNPTDGIIIIGGAPDLVESYCKLARKNPYVHMFLQKMCAGSDVGKAITTTLSLALALASNHGAYNGPLFISPEGYAKKAEQIMADRQVDDDEDIVESVNTSNGTASHVS